MARCINARRQTGDQTGPLTGTAPIPGLEYPGFKSMTQKRCFRFDDEIPHLKETYRRLALVSHRRHVDRLEPDGETLIVSSDWLLWQRCVHEGRQCIHGEVGITGRELKDVSDNSFPYGNDWIYVNGEDVTEFGGVSLGRKFIRETGYVVVDYEKLRHAFETLVGRFQPREVVFFDFRIDNGSLDAQSRLAIVGEIAGKSGITLIDRNDPVDNADLGLVSSQQPSPVEQTKADRRALTTGLSRRLYENVVTAMSWFRRVSNCKRPTVLFLLTGLITIPLLERFDGRGIFPKVPARIFPRKKNVGFLLRCLVKGVLLVGSPRSSLTQADRDAVEAMYRRLEDAWKAPATGREEVIRHYVRTNILEPKRLQEKALDVKRAEKFLNLHKPDQIFTDGLRNATYSTFLELANARGIATTAIWHGPYVHDMKVGVFGSDPRFPPLIDLCLTWGEAQEVWLERISAKTAPLRTGSPVTGQYQRFPKREGNGRHALVLQYAFPTMDVGTRVSVEFEYFVETVRMLRDCGYTDIRFKLHPGSPKLRYYRKVAEYFDVECELHDSGLFREFVAWADFVIGTVVSGSMLEVAAAGKPYFPVLLPPHSVNMQYLETCRVFTDFESLGEAVRTGNAPDLRDYLEFYASVDQIPDPAQRVWQALRGEIRPVGATDDRPAAGPMARTSAVEDGRQPAILRAPDS